MRKLFFFFFGIEITAVALTLMVKADSPLTSTDFWRAYSDIPLVYQAHESGMIDQSMANFLADENQSVDVRAALINALSWKFEGKQNATRFLNLRGKDAFRGLSQLSTAELFAYGYLLALDNYFETSEAEKALRIALRRNKNFTTAMIHHITRSQSLDWSQIWPQTQQILKTHYSNGQMRPEAVQIITNYLGLYAEYATNNCQPTFPNITRQIKTDSIPGWVTRGMRR